MNTTRTLLRAGAAVALMLAFTACGGQGDNQSPTTQDNQTQDALLQYAQCMRQNGVDIPDPVAGDPGSLYQGVDKTSPAFVSANKSCGHFLENVVQQRQTQDQGDQQQQDAQLLQLATCLREHGINVKDPVPGKGFGDDLKRSDPNTAKALQQCQQSTTPSS